jgi:hypothetical protein
MMSMIDSDLPVPTPQSVFDGLFDLSRGGLPGSQAELQVQDRWLCIGNVMGDDWGRDRDGDGDEGQHQVADALASRDSPWASTIEVSGTSKRRIWRIWRKEEKGLVNTRARSLIFYFDSGWLTWTPLFRVMLLLNDIFSTERLKVRALS